MTRALKTDVLEPYLKTGGLPSYIEKGEMLLICNNEFFVNDCYPRDGLIAAHTVIEIEIGFTKEVFQRKQILADQRIASRLQSELSFNEQPRAQEDSLMRLFIHMHH